MASNKNWMKKNNFDHSYEDYDDDYPRKGKKKASHRVRPGRTQKRDWNSDFEDSDDNGGYSKY